MAARAVAEGRAQLGAAAVSAFAERLRQAADAEGLRPVDLAERTGIDSTNVSHLLGGDRAPSMGTLHKLLLALPRTSARWLVTGKGKQNGNT